MTLTTQVIVETVLAGFGTSLLVTLPVFLLGVIFRVLKIWN